MAPPVENRRNKVFGPRIVTASLAACFLASAAQGGPYTEAGVNGYIGEDRRHANPLTDADANVNPIFRGWATGIADYQPADDEWFGGEWDDPNKALGPATGDNGDIVSLGDLDSNRVDEVVLFSKELLNEATDSIYVFPMCRDDFDKVRIVGQGFDEDLVTGDLLTKIV